MQKTHTCPATRCFEEIPSGTFMCKRHWSMLPQTLQSKALASSKLRKDHKNYRTMYMAVLTEARRVIARKVSPLA